MGEQPRLRTPFYRCREQTHKTNAMTMEIRGIHVVVVVASDGLLGAGRALAGTDDGDGVAVDTDVAGDVVQEVAEADDAKRTLCIVLREDVVAAGQSR